MNKKQAVIEAIHKVFGDFVDKDRIKKAVFTGKSDPGQWSPKALVVVHTESGIPNPCNYPELYDKWYKINDELKQMGFNLSFEPVNGAVIAFYEW
jgi:hypothetical protein